MGGRVAINAVCEDCVKKKNCGKSKIRWCWCKVKKDVFKTSWGCFSYKSVVKDAYFIDGIWCKERWSAVYVDVDLAGLGKGRKTYCDDFLKIWPKN